MIGISIALGVVLWLCLRRTAVAIALCFLLTGFVWRLVGAGYLNLAGPLYSYEAEMMVGGDSLAANMFGGLIALTVLVFAAVLRPGALQGDVARFQPATGPGARPNLGDLVFYAGALFVVALFVDMFRIGVIPLVHCIERYEYLAGYAGIFHHILFKYGSLIALQFGTFAVYPRLLGGRYDWRFLLLVAALFVYLPLTGNRFSAFYSFTLFFLTPLSLLWLLRSHPRFADAANGPGRRRYTVRERVMWIGLAAAGAVVVAFSLLNSYANVRYEKSACAEYRGQLAAKGLAGSPLATGSGAPMPPPAPMGSILGDIGLGETLDRFVSPEVQLRFTQRILVQPIHMYFITSDRVIGRGDWEPREAFGFIYDPELRANGNRSIRFLMNRTLPPERAAYLESVGNQFAGGYPEVLLELVGPWGVWVSVAAFAAITAWLLRFWMLSVLRGRFVTAFFAAYVYYAFAVMYVGGMLNFLIVWTFWSKVSLLVLFAWLEPYLERRGLRLLPWRLALPGPAANRT